MSGYRSRALAALLAVALGGFVAPASASAEPPPADELAAIAQDLLLAENAALLPAPQRDALVTGRSPATSPAAADKLALRRAVSLDRGFARELAGVRFDGVTTTTKVGRTTRTGDRIVADVEERTSYHVIGSVRQPTAVDHHRITYQQRSGRWEILDIETAGAASPVSDAQLALAARTSAEQRRARIAARTIPMRAALDRNRTALLAGDRAKMAGNKVAVAGDDTTQAAGSDDELTPSQPARPADRPLAAPGSGVRPLGGEGPPYNYSAMVDYAYYYSVNPVSYTRDENDCTTFISWALWTGGYAEDGAQDYPSVAWNHDDYNVWYWRCNDCSPRHSYTWGGATNWNIYEANYGNRVTALPYLSDLLISDVFQMDFDGYGGEDLPDHTTMVTGRADDGWPLLSYHSNDRQNWYIWDTIGTQDGPFWAIRT